MTRFLREYRRGRLLGSKDPDRAERIVPTVHDQDMLSILYPRIGSDDQPVEDPAPSGNEGNRFVRYRYSLLRQFGNALFFGQIYHLLRLLYSIYVTSSIKFF